MCAKLSAQLWCHSYGAITTKSPILSNINHPAGQPTLQNIPEINISQHRTGKLYFSCKIEIDSDSKAVTWMAAVVVAFISWMRLNFDISTGHEIPHTVDSYTKDRRDFNLNLAAFFLANIKGYSNRSYLQGFVMHIFLKGTETFIMCACLFANLLIAFLSEFHLTLHSSLSLFANL